MRFLGRGWQYSTYDLGNGRVLKKYNSVPVGYWHMFKTCFPFTNDAVWKLPGYYRDCRAKAFESIRKLPDLTLEGWMMGNPRILNSLDYEQDLLVPFHAHLESVDRETGERTIDAFIAFNRHLVENGLIDKSFNITKNFALDSKGRVVLMDLGEIYTSPEAIHGQIRKRAWAHHYIASALPKDLRTYFIDGMDTEFKAEIGGILSPYP